MIDSRMLWLDFETTGLDPDSDKILEVGTILTNGDLEEISSYHRVIHQPEDVLAKMNDWCKKTHSESGLVKEVRASGHDLVDIEQELIAHINKEFGSEKPILCGSSIHFDRSFIRKHMPYLDKRLHYRMIDVSSFMEAFRLMYGYSRKDYGRKTEHRVLADGRASIADMKHYKQFINGREMRISQMFDDELP